MDQYKWESSLSGFLSGFLSALAICNNLK